MKTFLTLVHRWSRLKASLLLGLVPSACVAKVDAMLGSILREVLRALTAMATVMFFPSCGRMRWFAREFSIGHGERTFHRN